MQAYACAYGDSVLIHTISTMCVMASYALWLNVWASPVIEAPPSMFRPALQSRFKGCKAICHIAPLASMALQLLMVSCKFAVLLMYWLGAV